MSQTQGFNPFDDDDSHSKEYEGAAHYAMNSSHEQQTAGDSQYQDQPPPRAVASNPLLSPPPASAPPPPPPPSDSDAGSVRSINFHDDDSSSSAGYPTIATPPPAVHRTHMTPTGSSEINRYSSSVSTNSSSNNYYGSYHNDPRAAAVPMITNYGVSPAQTFYPPNESFEGAPKISTSMFGDISIRPNTGQTNSEIGGFGSLREVTGRLRWFTIACTLSALIWEGFAFPARLLVHTWDHPAKVVLGGYLAFFCLLLLGVELNAPLRDLFGVLYHPLGRGFLLTLMSSMCYGIHISWWEILLCVAFAGCSLGYIYAYVKYPEYRRWQDYNDNQIWSDMRYAVRRRSFGESAHWADPVVEQRGASQSILGGGGNQTWRDTQRETQSLLHQV
jgi:hypothetical protein